MYFIAMLIGKLLYRLMPFLAYFQSREFQKLSIGCLCLVTLFASLVLVISVLDKTSSEGDYKAYRPKASQ